jgi:hypothetical protein
VGSTQCHAMHAHVRHSPDGSLLRARNEGGLALPHYSPLILTGFSAEGNGLGRCHMRPRFCYRHCLRVSYVCSMARRPVHRTGLGRCYGVSSQTSIYLVYYSSVSQDGSSSDSAVMMQVATERGGPGRAGFHRGQPWSA